MATEEHHPDQRALSNDMAVFSVEKVVDNCAPVRWSPEDLETWGVFVSCYVSPVFDLHNFHFYFSHVEADFCNFFNPLCFLEFSITDLEFAYPKFTTATGGLYWDGPRYFEPRSPELEPLQTSTPNQWADVWSPTYYFTCNRPAYKADFQRNRVSNLEPSNPKAKSLPLDHRDPHPRRVGRRHLLHSTNKSTVFH
ncbi:hypothetical protein AVEN_32769-1 [Araneus ventricosus]|uniref:Uncharacterized protein n=1 Tax=Araneus ventricosus TaxID=182803 RepID=A0A4Y2CV27_ARAVE|nr:hypothetical protein AVEN_32769-1 [Araneus ventricosus]